MRYVAHTRHHLLAFVLACGLSPIIKAQDTRAQDTRAQDTRAQDTANGVSAQERAQTQAQARPEIERQRQDAERQAQQTLDKDAIAAIQETQSAIRAISENKREEALAAIERATGKISVLLARNPATALIPVNAEVEVIEAAPLDVKAIKSLAERVEEAVDDRDYPAARLLLQALTSEIRVRTYNLPLATYPDALREAARLVDQNKPKDASAVLSVALNTLVIIDRVTPLPLALASAAIQEAMKVSETDKERALQLLSMARQELERAKHLGYAGKDPEYAALDNSISEVEKTIKGNQNSSSIFAKLRDRVTSFFKRQSEGTRVATPDGR